MVRQLSAALVEVRLSASAAAWAMLAHSGRQLSGAARVLVVRFEPEASESSTAAPSPLQASSSDVESSLLTLARPDLVSVAVVDAPLAGAALAIALDCDLRLWSLDGGLRASAEAMGSLGRLGELVGYSRALELCLTGRHVHAADAVSLGLATLAVAADQLGDALDDLLGALVATPRDQAIELKAALSPSGLDTAGRVRRLRAELAAAARLRGEHE